MIALDDPIWSELAHAYGDGSDIPPQLIRIETRKSLSKKFWDDLTNTLCHQCIIGTAGLAAFPHLVRLADDHSQSQKGFQCLELASLILMLALGPENKIPRVRKELSVPFRNAIADGRRVVMEMYDQKRRTLKDNMLYLSMVAIFDRRTDIGSLLGELCLGWYDCPKCEERIEIDELCTW